MGVGVGVGVDVGSSLVVPEVSLLLSEVSEEPFGSDSLVSVVDSAVVPEVSSEVSEEPVADEEVSSVSGVAGV